MSWGVWVAGAIVALIAFGAWQMLGWSFGGTPARMVMSTGADENTPVVPVRLGINGRNHAGPLVAVSKGWKDKTGSGTNLVSMAPPKDGKNIAFDVEWVEVFTQDAYASQLTIPVSDFDIHQLSEPHLRISILFGPGGALEIWTSSNDSHAIQPRLVQKLCGTRKPDKDIDYLDPANGALIKSYIRDRRGNAQPGASCAPDKD